MQETRMELIAAFEPVARPETVVLPFLSDNENGEVTLGNVAKYNKELVDELNKDGWVLVSTAPSNNLVYGFFTKTT